MRVVFWGTYDLGKPRTRILLSGLRSAGVEVLQIHTDLWRGVEDKSQVGSAGRIKFLVRLLLAYPGLVYRYLKAPRHDAVVVAYLGQFDVLVLWLFAKLRRAPIAWDMFISLYDTVVFDRRLVKPNSIMARCIWGFEWLGCRMADRVLMDTGPHARYVERILSLAPGQVGSVLVGAEPEQFPRLPPPTSDGAPIRVLFYGQLIPLHGVRTILEAAASPGGQAFRWVLIGSGQDEPLVREFLDANPIEHLVWEKWTPYESLGERIASADICLGIFGESEKAASVVPNKVYQALSAGRAIVTRDSPAMRELLPLETQGVRLIPPADPEALLDAIASLEAEGCPQPPEAVCRTIAPSAIGMRLRAELEALTGARTVSDAIDA
jgi:glycosyltransferase involved in cell wall biosynthesis